MGLSDTAQSILDALQTRGERVRELEAENARLRAMRERGLASDSVFASCGCLTKTDKIEFHRPGCKYRLIVERDVAREKLARCQEMYRRDCST